jgi:hypothetical protein
MIGRLMARKGTNMAMSDQERKFKAEFSKAVASLIEKADPKRESDRTALHNKTVKFSIEIPYWQATTFLMAEIRDTHDLDFDYQKRVFENFQGDPFNKEHMCLLSERILRLIEHTHSYTRKHLTPTSKSLSPENPDDENKSILDIVAAIRVLGSAAQQMVHFDKHGEGISAGGVESIGEFMLADAISYLARGDSESARCSIDEFDEWVKNGRASWIYTEPNANKSDHSDDEIQF